MLLALIAIAELQKTLEQLKRRGKRSTIDEVTSSSKVYEINKLWNTSKTYIKNEQIEKQTFLLSLNMNSLGGVTNAGSIVGHTSEDYVDGTTAKIINFNASDKQCCHEIVGNNVKVIVSAGKHDHGSSKVKLKNFVDYKWEVKNYPGHLIAVHNDGKHIAYVINVSNKARMEGMVRVVNAQSGLRALIKGMCGEVLDLQFAEIERERILASIDANSLYVHKIILMDGTLMCSLILKVEDPLANYTPKYDKISWCPFLNVSNESDNDEDQDQMIAWARGSVFQCFNVKTIVAEHGIGVVHPGALSAGYLKFRDDTITITWIALSPDKSSLAVGSTDGFIRFYLVYMFEQEPRRLHQWMPHGGKPVSSFFFLDNWSTNQTDTYWTYAITAASNNTEFKIWDCGAWDCLQTITIATSMDELKTTPRFIAEIDRTANYLVISSLEIRAAYVIQIVNNAAYNSKNSTSDDKDLTQCSSNGSVGNASSIGSALQVVAFKSISEFPLSSGVLSFSIVNAAVRRLKCSNENYLCDELDDYDEESNTLCCVVVHMFIVQSKSMQECRILYQPTVTFQTDVKSTLSMDDSLKNDDKTNKSKNSSSCVVEPNDPLNLMQITDIKTEKRLTPEQNALEKLFAKAAATVVAAAANSANTASQIIQTTSSSVVAVAAAAAAAPSAVAQDAQLKSHSVSPQTNMTTYAQLNLMTPDAFNASNDKKTPENVSTEVLNTILMLAGVTGQTPAINKPDNMNLLNLVNNKLIEEQEHQKMQSLQQSLESREKFIAIDRHPGRNAVDNLASGGSSPSREVQEIMSIQSNTYSGDEELIDDLPVQCVNDDSITDIDSATNKTSSNKNWPKPPEVHKVQTKHSAELQNAANLISQAVNASHCSNNAPPTLGSGSNKSNSNNNISNTQEIVNADMADLNIKMNQLIDLVKVQSKQINSLQSEIAEMRKVGSAKNISEFSFKLEMQLSKLMEQYLKRYENEHKKKLSAFMQGRDVQNRELSENFIQIINRFALNQFGDVVAKVINVEIQRQLAPLLVAKMDHLQQQIQIDVAQKLTAFDSMLKENISQVCKSKNIIEAFGKSVLVGVQGSLQAAFIESMSSTLIPAYEKSSQNMFKQLHDAFSVGIKEFMEQIDIYLQHLQPMQDSSADMLNKFGGFRQHIDTMLTKQRNAVTETMLETRKDVKSLEILMARQIQETIRVELRKCFENQTVALRSQANTPAPMYDAKETIKLLLHQGQTNKAFHQALLANDLNLVEYTLKSTDHTNVFTPDCCLEQKVLLSLIQQISADMSNHNEVKQNYLAEALLAINPADPITREHAPKVLQELYRNCQVFLKNYPKSPQCSNVRMLLKGVHSYKVQF